MFDQYCEGGCFVPPIPFAPKPANDSPSIGAEFGHVSDHDLERFYLGAPMTDFETAALNGHLRSCPPCAERADRIQSLVDAFLLARDVADGMNVP